MNNEDKFVRFLMDICDTVVTISPAKTTHKEPSKSSMKKDKKEPTSNPLVTQKDHNV